MLARRIGFASLVLAVGFVAAGCRVRARVVAPPPVTVSASVDTPPPPTATVQVSAPTVQAGVTVVESTCTQGAPEQCNGLDDNCDGRIDEGCGYGTGAIQITLAWNTGADLDMYVTDPSGETISYSHTRSSTGGYLDHDARGNCRADQPNNRIENIYWNSPTPPAGGYSIQVHYWGECGGAGPTQAVVSIAVGGRLIGAYQFVITPQQRMEIAQFQL